MRQHSPTQPSAASRDPEPGYVAALVACLVVIGITGAALSFSLDLRAIPEARVINVFYWFQREFEPVPLVIALVSTVLLLLALLRGRRAPVAERAGDLLVGGADVSWRAAWILGGLVTLVTFGITHWVMHDYALSGDEWSASFQAKIFARGMLTAPVPVEWRPWAPAMLPHYIRYDAATGTWASMYLPVYAAIRSLFVRLGVETLTNPVLAGLTVVGLTGVARRLWPGEGRMQWLALGALVTSSQFLLMSGTAYAMPAHLCLNTWWLWCWLRREESGWYVAALPVIGVAALGLHQPFPHALFVAPFLVRLLFERRWTQTICVGLVYATGCVTYFLLLQRSASSGGYAMRDLFALPDRIGGALLIQTLALLISWQAPCVAIGAVAGARHWASLPSAVRDLFTGLLATILFYALFRFDQQHGWGHRYTYAVLINVVLLAAIGVRMMAQYLRHRDARLSLATTASAAALVLLPIRCAQASRFTEPFSRAANALTESAADVVTVPARDIWYGTDFIRNAPFADGHPLIINSAPTKRTVQVPAIPSRMRIRALSANDFYRLGVPRRDMRLARLLLE